MSLPFTKRKVKKCRVAALNFFPQHFCSLLLFSSLTLARSKFLKTYFEQLLTKKVLSIHNKLFKKPFEDRILLSKSNPDTFL
jgi:hypothetical protein